MRSMNAPGSPSSPLQMTYLSGEVARGRRPFAAGGEARAAAAAQAGEANFVDDLFGRGAVEAFCNAWKPPSDGIHRCPRDDDAAGFGGDAILAVEEIGDMVFAHIDREPRDRLAALGLRAAYRGREATATERGAGRRPEVLEQDGLGLLGLHAGVEVRAAAGLTTSTSGVW